MPGLLGGGAVGAVLHFMQCYQEKLAQIDTRSLEVKEQRDKLTKELKVLQVKVNQLNPNKNKDTEEIQ